MFEAWPGALHCVFMVRHLTLSVPLFTQVYKWIHQAILTLGVINPAMDWDPI